MPRTTYARGCRLSTWTTRPCSTLSSTRSRGCSRSSAKSVSCLCAPTTSPVRTHSLVATLGCHVRRCGALRLRRARCSFAQLRCSRRSCRIAHSCSSFEAAPPHAPLWPPRITPLARAMHSAGRRCRNAQGGADDSFVRKCHKTFSSSPALYAKPISAEAAFSLTHYAGAIK